MRIVRIFLSSPGDCNADRAVTHEIAARLNADPVVATFARVEIVAWDWSTGVPLDALASPQVSVNKRLPVPEECDVFVGIFRCRFGTPLPATEFRKDNGALFYSGSEYEFDRARKARRRGAVIPEVLMYRLATAGTHACPAGEQFDRLNAFFASAPFRDLDGWTGSVNNFHDTGDFATRLEGHLRQLLSRWHPAAKLPLSVWLERHARRVEHDAGPRYTREAHVESDIPQVFDWLLARPKAIAVLDAALAGIWSKIGDMPEFAQAKSELEHIAAHMRADPLWRVPPDFGHVTETLERLASTAWDLERADEPTTPAQSTSEQYRCYGPR